MTGAEEEHAGHRLLQAAAKVNTTIATPEKEEEEHVDRHGIFPLPYLLFFAGYCLVLLVDRVFAGEYGHSHAHGANDHHHDEGEKPKAGGDNEKQSEKNQASPGHDQGPII
jgi:hypothetical protein